MLDYYAEREEYDIKKCWIDAVSWYSNRILMTNEVFHDFTLNDNG